MGRAERAETTGLHCCAACGGRFEIETTSEAERKRLRCGTCDRYEDVWILRAVGRWTLVDPSGSSRSFTARADLLAAIPPSSPSSLPPAFVSATAQSSKAHASSHQLSAERPSATSLLAESMAEAVPVPPSLSTPLALAAPMGQPTSSEPPPDSYEPVSLEPPSLEPVSHEPVSLEPVSLEPVSLEPVSLEPVSLEPVSMEAPSVDPASENAPAAPAYVESAPLTPAAQEQAPRPPTVSDIIRRPEPRAQNAEEDLEPLSARDVMMVLTPPPRTSVRPSRPPPLPVSVNPPRLSKPPSVPSVPSAPPKAGELTSKPLRDPLAPPPPTITVESERPAAVRAKLREAASATSSDEVPRGKEPPVTVRSTNDERPSIKATLSEEPSRGRPWLIPVVAVAGIGAMIWVLKGPTASNDASPPTARPEPVMTSTPTTMPMPTSVASVVETIKPAPSAASSASPAPSALAARSATPSEKPVVAALPMTAPSAAPTRLPDLLDRAAAARKAGDFARAKEFYERALAQNGSNVEAHSGLGDIARAQGELATAKTSYEKALDAAPQYMPALLGLADTEWDLGQRDAAQRHYVTLTQLPMQAPERVKQRANAGSAPATASTSEETTSSTAPQAASPKATTQAASPPVEDTSSE